MAKKLILLNILEILRNYTDEEHRLGQKEIQEILKKEYDMTIDRKTIKTSLMSLEEFGYDLGYSSTYRPVKKDGVVEESYVLSDFYLRRDFEDSELRLLIDSLLFSRHIPFNQCKDLCGKLEKLSNQYFKARVRHIATMPQDRTNNQQLFYVIDVLDEAISNGKKVKFKYLEYHTDMTQTARKSHSGEDRVYVVSPYQMAAKEGKYYLICNYDCYDDIANYRLDRIAEIEMTDEPARPFEQLKGSNGRRLNLTQYMNDHIYMYSSGTTQATLRIINEMISDIIDTFGANVRFENQNEKHVDVRVSGNEMAIVQFAHNYAPYVVVLEPESLRNKVIESLQNGLRGYN